MNAIRSILAVVEGAVSAFLADEEPAGIRVAHTGAAVARKGGTATSGVSVTGSVIGPVEVEDTGPADAREGGEVTSGLRVNGKVQQGG